MKGRRKIIDMAEQLPPGLEYQEAHWEAALGMIEAHEKKVAWYKVAGGITAAACLVAAVLFWNLQSATTGDTLINMADNQSVEAGWNADFDRVIPPFVSSEDDELPYHISENSVRSITSASILEPANADEENELKASGDDTSAETSMADAEASDDNSSSEIDSTLADERTAETNSNQSEHNTSENIGLNPEANSLETSLSGEGITLQIEEKDTSIPVPPGHLNTTTANNKDVSSAQLEDDITTAQPQISNQRSEQWLTEVEGIIIADLDSGVEPQIKESKTEDIAPHKLWTPRKRLNFQAMAGYQLWTDYMDDSWDLIQPNINSPEAQLILSQRTHNSRTDSRLLFGIGVDYDLNKRWSLNASPHYHAVSGLNFSHSSIDTQVVHNDGHDYQSRTVFTTKLHYISLPVSVALRIRNKWQVSTGIGASFLLQGDNVLQTRDENTLDISVTETQGYVTRFKDMNTFAHVGLNYYLTESITLGATYQYGLSDITREDMFSLSDGSLFNTIDRNSRAYAYLRFRIW